MKFTHLFICILTVTCSCVPEEVHKEVKVPTSLSVDSLTNEEEELLVYTYDDEYDTDSLVTRFVNLVLEGQAEIIAHYAKYPLARSYPIPSIKDSADFIRRYHEVFDEKLTKMIIESTLTDDWQQMLDRGIMLNSGSLWLDNSGHLIAVNYQAELDSSVRAKMHARGTDTLHESIRDFEKPSVLFTTPRYKIRIDQQKNGDFRYTSWQKDQSQRSKPELIIKNGERVWDGSAGNHHYVFKNGIYSYVCHITLLGKEENQPVLFYVYKNEEEILQQESVQIVYQ